MSSFRYHTVEIAARLLGHRKNFSKKTEPFRAFLEKERDRRNPDPPFWIQRKYAVRAEQVLGRPLYVIAPAARAAAGGKPGKANTALLFIHGGGFIMEAHPVHWRIVARIIDALGIPVWFPAYPLVSGTPAPGDISRPSVKNIFEMIWASYSLMLESHPNDAVVFLGDSAGTTLALSFCHHNKALGLPLPMPRRLILVSPAMITEQDPAILEAMRRIEPKDALLSMTLMDSLTEILGLDLSRDNYYNAPLYGDFRGFPPMDVFAGDRDICFPLARPFVERARQAGVPVDFREGRGMMHVWPYMPFAPECEAALAEIIGIIGKV